MSIQQFYNNKAQTLYQGRKATLISQGMTEEEADLKAKEEVQEFIIQSHSPSRPDLPYNANERPRLLEANSFNLNPDDMFGLAAVFMLVKQPKMFESITTKWLDNQQRIIHALAQAQHNPIAAYTNSFLIALMLEQQYYIRQRGADDMIGALNWVWGANAAQGILATLFGGSSQFPTSIVYATTNGSENRAELLRAFQGKGESGKTEKKDDEGQEIVNKLIKAGAQSLLTAGSAGL